MKPIILIVALMASTLPLHAQREADIKATALEVIDATISTQIGRFANEPNSLDHRADIIDQFIPLLTEIVARLNADHIGRRKLADEWRFRRADIQTGAGTSSGTTSAVLNPLFPAIFGVSMESGSITRTITGNTVSIKINPAGLFCSSAAPGTEAARKVNSCLDWWRRFGASISFDTSRGDVPEGITSIESLNDQFSEVAIRVSLLNRRDPKNPAFQKRMREWSIKAKDYANTLNKEAPKYQSFIDSSEVVVTATDLKTEEKRVDSVRNGMAKWLSKAYLSLEEEHIIELTRLADKWIATEEANRSLYYQYAHGWVVSGEYAFQRPDISTEMIGLAVPAGTRPPSLHTVRLLAAKGFPDRLLDFNFNLSMSWFQEKRSEMDGRWRDIRIGVEGKFYLKTISNWGVPVLSFAGVWMNLRQRPLGLGVIIQGENIDKTGHIGVFQTKLEIPTANAAVRIPISFTWANRTELVRESDVRGQIGITVNFDALFVSSSQ